MLVDLGVDGQVSFSSWPDAGLPEAMARGPLDAAALADLR